MKISLKRSPASRPLRPAYRALRLIPAEQEQGASSAFAALQRESTLIAWANMLGRSDCACVLQQNLDEEKATDSKLSTMALKSVNRKAA